MSDLYLEEECRELRLRNTIFKQNLNRVVAERDQLRAQVETLLEALRNTIDDRGFCPACLVSKGVWPDAAGGFAPCEHKPDCVIAAAIGLVEGPKL